VPRPFPRKISQIKPTLSQVGQSSHFAMQFAGLGGNLRSHLRDRGLDSRFITDNLTLLCCRASLPGSGFATADVVGNYMGVAEKFAHTRTFVQMDVDFYVDYGYKSLKFVEHWMEFISSGSETGFDNVNPLRSGYYYRMRYPNEYKCDETRIIKFERDYKRYIEYRFFGLFPISLNAVPVSYEGSQVLKATATFHFDRYYSGQSRSINERNSSHGNRDDGATRFGLGGSTLDNFNAAAIYGNKALSESFSIPNDLGLVTSNFINTYENVFSLGGKDLGEGQSLGTRRAD